MNSCDFAASITALACAIAKDKSDDELTILAVLFTQLGDTLATIATHNAICNPSDVE